MKPAEAAHGRCPVRRAVALAMGQVLFLAPWVGCGTVTHIDYEWMPLSEDKIQEFEEQKILKVTYADGRIVQLREVTGKYPEFKGMTDVGDIVTVHIVEDIKVEYLKAVEKTTSWWSENWWKIVVPIVAIAVVIPLVVLIGVAYYRGLQTPDGGLALTGFSKPRGDRQR